MNLSKISLKRMTRSFVAAGILAATVGTTAMALLPIDGGVWDYGVRILTVYSDYYHPNEIHGSTVEGAFKDTDYNVAPGQTSHASAEALLRGNKCYYCLGYVDPKSRSADGGSAGGSVTIDRPDAESQISE